MKPINNSKNKLNRKKKLFNISYPKCNQNLQLFLYLFLRYLGQPNHAITLTTKTNLAPPFKEIAQKSIKRLPNIYR